LINANAFIVFVSQRPHGSPLERVGSRLRRRQTRHHRRLAAGKREVNRQVVTSELQHPRGGHGWCSEKCKVVLVLAERDATAGARWSAAPTAGVRSGNAPTAGGLIPAKHFVAAHDVDDLPIARWAEGSRQQVHHRGALRRVQICQAQAFAPEDATREVRPLRFLRTCEGELHFGASRFIEQCGERLGRGDNPRRRLGWRVRRRRSRGAGAALSDRHCRYASGTKADEDADSNC
jgi:hypothetical protein